MNCGKQKRPDVRPFAPDAGDLCGRCASSRLLIVARSYHSSGWVINVCNACLTTEERLVLDDTLADGLYLSGLR